MVDISAEVAAIKSHIEEVRVQKRERLKNLDFFCLDNSIRESTVGQLRGHTLQNKIEIYEHVKKCGIKDIIVASFAHLTRVDDDFVQHLQRTGEDFTNFYSFSEVTEGVVDGAYNTETVPIALLKNKKYGLNNIIFEIDLVDSSIEWGTKFTVDDMCAVLRKRIKFVKNQISPQGKVLLNFRDFPLAMSKTPERLLAIVNYLSCLPDDERMFAIMYEDPFGECLPEELEAWTVSIRRVMTNNNWIDGKILVHIHDKWDMKTACQLDCLSAGADGVWTSLCEEGGAAGQACSSVTIMNLVRLGNTKVLKKYNCTYLRKAAIAVTELTTGKSPHIKQVIYGERAFDVVFGGFGVGDFNLADFFGMETPNRISTFATAEMLKEHLVQCFGHDTQFNDEICSNMKELMLTDLRSGRKEEYQSTTGIAMLFDRAGGKLTPKMAEVIEHLKLTEVHHDDLIAEIRKEWDSLPDNCEEGENKGDGQLQFDSFYHGFMSPYFSCYGRAKKGLVAALDMDNDGFVDWNEFLVYIKWALHQYPETIDPDVLLSIVFEKGLIPAMRDENITNMHFE